ncbi:ATP-binding protein [Desulfobacterales bacterium HSG17]|nr:ATP-binding protein [Desulfobacterales bacterium HSG17]
MKHIKDEFDRKDKDRLLARLEDASSEFRRNIDNYQTWFDFYDSAVRDFTIPEVVQAAERIVWDINFAKIREKRIKPASLIYGQGINDLYLLGKNFHDILKIFKILYQNVVYHAVTKNTDKEIGIEIKADLDEITSESRQLNIIFSTRHDDASVDTACLMKMICDNELRQQALLKRQGTGLATIADILLNRLKGASGKIEDISWNDKERWFQVKFNILVSQEGKTAELTRDEALQSIPVEELANKVKDAKGLKILIVEDQSLKFAAMRNFVDSILTGSHITHTWNIETTCRLLLHPDIQFDLILLDMTLPVEPSFDAELKSLAGMVPMKVMSLNNIFVPTVIITQYSNWADEAARNTKVFIEKLDQYCKESYGKFYKGTIRFSHTETQWQKDLRGIIYSLQEMATTYLEQGDYAKAIEFYENKLESNSKDSAILSKLGDARRRIRNYSGAIGEYQKVLEIEPNSYDALSGIALTYAEMGDTESSDSYFNKCKNICAEDAESLRERILDAKLKTINQRRQQLYRNEMMATLGQMASNMAHELNTPLQLIKTIAQSTNRFMKKDKITPEDMMENMDGIVNAVNMMAKQVNHIRALAKEDHLKTEPVNLNAVIQDAFNFFTQQFKNNNITVIFEFHQDLLEINANRSRVEQIFINLIQNAFDALLQVKDRKKEILVRTQYTRGDTPVINIYFEDNGIGIKEDLKDKLFDPFFTTKPPGKGMGIGLSIVREAVTELGGDIKTFAESSVGLTFIITIPVKNKEV